MKFLMGNTQPLMGDDVIGEFIRQSSSEFDKVLLPVFEQDYYSLLENITTWSKELMELVASFLQKPYAGCTEEGYFKRAETHMEFNFQHAWQDNTKRLGSAYLKQFRKVWFRFDEAHTGTILFEDVINLINALHEEFDDDTWRYDPFEYVSICKQFPNTVITYTEFCLWAEYGEIYGAPIDDRWDDVAQMHGLCFKHGQLYCPRMTQIRALEQLMAAFCTMNQEYLSMNDIRRFLSRRYRDNALIRALGDILNDLSTRLKSRMHFTILLGTTRAHFKKLSMYDLSINCFRSSAFIPIQRRRKKKKKKPPIQKIDANTFGTPLQNKRNLATPI